MEIIIAGKNYTPSNKLKETLKKKFEKLYKYFSNEIIGHIIAIKEKASSKIEATINAKGMIFRVEMRADDSCYAIDRIIKKFRARCQNSNLNSQKIKNRMK